MTSRQCAISASQRPVLRVGHKGADLIAPGNTAESFDAALEAGVDMIEFDVLRTRTRIVLAHDFGDVARRTPLTLDEGLAYLASPPFDGIGFLVDLKRLDTSFGCSMRCARTGSSSGR